MRRVLLLALTLFAVAAPALVAQPAQAAVACTPRGSQIFDGEYLASGECLVSRNGNFYLKMQTDGNLVLVRANGSVCWAANWEIGNTFRRGDRMYFTTTWKIYSGWRNEIYLSDTGPGPRTQYRYRAHYYDQGELKIHTASLNNKGEFWIGNDRHHWC